MSTSIINYVVKYSIRYIAIFADGEKWIVSVTSYNLILDKVFAGSHS